MGFAVELALDESASRAVRGIWQDLADAGLTYMATSGADPHISLILWDHVDPAALEGDLTAFAREVAPVAVSLSSVGAFHSAVLLAPTPTPALLDVHARFHQRFAGLGARPSGYYAPGVWVPHCTLALDLTPDTMPTALVVACRAALPIGGSLKRMDLVEFRPVRFLSCVPLTGPRPDGVPLISPRSS